MLYTFIRLISKYLVLFAQYIFFFSKTKIKKITKLLIIIFKYGYIINIAFYQKGYYYSIISPLVIS